MSDSKLSTAAGHSRRGILGKAVLTGLAAVPVVGMLNKRAAAAAPFTPETLGSSSREAFSDLMDHENDHVARLKGVLGKAARPKPTFKGLTTTSFTEFAGMKDLLASQTTISGLQVSLFALFQALFAAITSP